MGLTTEIGPATREEVGAFYVAAGEHTVLRVDGTAIALGAVRTIGDRAWVMLDLAPAARLHGVRLVRAVHRCCVSRNETLYAVCGFPAAERLLTVLGFAPTDETVAGGKRVWKWRKR